jgi:hypothetical protein
MCLLPIRSLIDVNLRKILDVGFNYAVILSGGKAAVEGSSPVYLCQALTPQYTMVKMKKQSKFKQSPAISDKKCALSLDARRRKR